MFNRMRAAEFRKLVLEFAEANNLPNPFNKTKERNAARDSSKLSWTLKPISFHAPQATITKHIVTNYDAN